MVYVSETEKALETALLQNGRNMFGIYQLKPGDDLHYHRWVSYAELQRLGQLYQEQYDYHKKYNRAQLEKLKELCAVMQLDLILHYNALEADE